MYRLLLSVRENGGLVFPPSSNREVPRSESSGRLRWPEKEAVSRGFRFGEWVGEGSLSSEQGTSVCYHCYTLPRDYISGACRDDSDVCLCTASNVLGLFRMKHVALVMGCRCIFLFRGIFIASTLISDNHCVNASILAFVASWMHFFGSECVA